VRAITVAIPAGAARQVSIGADLVKYLSGAAGGLDPTVSVHCNRYSSPIPLLPGQGFRYAELSTDWWLTNSNAHTVTVTILFASGGFIDDRITGVVEVVDSARARTLAGLAFTGSVSVGAVAAQYACASLWSVGAAAKNLVISQITLSSAVAQYVQLRRSGVGSLPTVGTAYAKRLYGTNGSCNVKGGNLAALIGDYVAGYAVQAAAPIVIRPPEPYVVPPSTELIACSGNVNTDLVVTWDFVEEPV
jgi:hypothetical protein